jgi:hypothetical protein
MLDHQIKGANYAALDWALSRSDEWPDDGTIRL